MIEIAQIFLIKAEESLDGAESEFVNGRHNNCANRCYYACFQAAIYALTQAGIQPSGDDTEWRHAFVQARFARDLINRHKLYQAALGSTLSRNMLLRKKADYKYNQVTATEAGRALQRTREFLTSIQSGR